MTDQIQKVQSTLFKRVIAIIVDFIILAIIGAGLGTILSFEFAQLANHGVLVGWLIATIYFGISNSKIASGQSVGKKMTSLQVVDNNGDFLNIRQAFIRSLFFTTPFFLLEYFQNLSLTPQIISHLLGAINIAYYVGLLYFFIANKQDRRTVHDIFAKTCVKFQDQTEVAIQEVSKLKVYVYSGIVTIILASFIGTYFWFNTVSDLTEVFEANQDVLTEMAVEISELEEVLWIASSKINVTVDSEVGIVVEAWTRQNVNEINPEAIYDQIINIVSSKSFKISRIDYSEVILNYGYDIGIADYKATKSWKNENGK